jgi:uncharacterized membrane protein YqjE
MSASPPTDGGWLESLRRIGESFLSLLRSRFELFTVELQEEKLRLLNLFIWLVLAAACGFAGVFVTIIALAFWLWAAAGYWGLLGLAVVSLATAVGIIFGIRNKLQTGPAPFAQTVAEFRKDGECLRKNN